MAATRGVARSWRKFSPKIAILKQQFLNPIRKPDLAAIGHGLDLLAVFPWFRLVPRHLGSAMIVWVAD
jgi:hypothetical protein